MYREKGFHVLRNFIFFSRKTKFLSGISLLPKVTSVKSRRQIKAAVFYEKLLKAALKLNPHLGTIME